MSGLLPFLLNRASNTSLTNYYTKAEVDALVLTQTDPRRNALAPRGGVAFDGTADCGWASALTGQTIGADGFSIVRTFRVPATTPSAFMNLACVGPNLANFAANGSFAVRLGSNAGGVLDIVLVNGSGQSRRLLYDIVANFGGKVVQLVVIRPGSGDIQAFINGTQVPLVLNSSAASAQDSITSTFFYGGRGVVGNNYTDHSATLYNLALSAADVLEIYELGGAVPERFKFGTQPPHYSSDFSAGTDSWTINNGTGDGNIDGISGENDVLRYFADNTANQHRIFRTTRSAPTKGRVSRVSFRYFVPASNTNLKRLGVLFTETSPQVIMPVYDTWTTYEAVREDSGSGTLQILALDAASSAFFTGAGTVTNDLFYVKNVTVRALGAVVHLPLNDGAGFQLRDDSTNALHALMTTTGVTHVLPRPGGVFPLRFTTNTNGNQQALGAACIPTNCQIVRVRARTRSGSATVSLGNASGGAQIVSGAALTTAWSVLTIVGGSHITSTQNLWVSSNSTSVVEWDIEAEELRL